MPARRAAVLEMALSRPAISAVSPVMIQAGRSAFLQERANLDDLWDYFPTDLDQFLARIFVAMAGAAN
jgi:hypothetical protein